MRHFALTLLASAVFGLPIYAQTATFNVPFEFSAGNKTVAPGQYTMRYSAGAPNIQVVGLEQRASYFVSTHQSGSNTSPEPRLIFSAYGNQYFLSEVWIGASKSELVPSRAENELKKSNIAAVRQVIAGTR